MMINDMKKNELTEQEMNGVAGGIDNARVMESIEWLNENASQEDFDEKVCEAASTAWEVVKYAFEICG